MSNEEKAQQKARDDWQNEASYNNSYKLGSNESLAYQIEFSRVANTFGEHGSMY